MHKTVPRYSELFTYTTEGNQWHNYIIAYILHVKL